MSMNSVRSVRNVCCALLVGLLAALTLAACGGADSGSKASSGNAAPASRESRGAEAAQADAGGKAAPRAPGAADKPGAKQVKLDPIAGNRAVAYTATLRIRAKNVDEAATLSKQLVTGAGGYVESESAAGDAGRSSLTFKIPSDRYAATLDQLTGRLGTKLELRQQAEDVTEEVADVDSRVRSAQASLASFRKLLDRARSIGEVINVEREIETRQADLEALQARQKTLAQRTRYATVTLELSGPVKQAAPADPKEHEGGFVGGLKKGWKAFVAVVLGLALALGILLPFLVALAVLAVLAFFVRRYVRTRRPATPPAMAPPGHE